ncbi:MAG: hypothetical protein ABIK28_08610 [Planctomycetota bacterium]
MIPKDQPVITIVELKNTDVQLKWSGVEKAGEVELKVRGAVEEGSPPPEITGTTAGVHGLVIGTDYTFEIWGQDKKGGSVRLAFQNFKLLEGGKKAGVLRPEDFDPPVTEKLNLITLLSIPEEANPQKADQFHHARKVLGLVARQMTEIFIGDTYPIGGRDEIVSLEDTRQHLKEKGYRMLHGLEASSVLAVDLRLPDREQAIPCQLSIRLLDISHPDNRYEKLWNRRPLIYEDFVEIEDFLPSDDESSYDKLIRALENGFRTLCKDPVVRVYQKLVSDPTQDGYFRKIEDCVGRNFDVSNAEGTEDRAAISYSKALSLMFPVRDDVYEIKPPAPEEHKVADEKPAGVSPEMKPQEEEKTEESHPESETPESEKPKEGEPQAEPEMKTDTAGDDTQAVGDKKDG